MIKQMFLLFSVLMVSLSSFAVQVNGYYRKNGTYVDSYNRTAPDNNSWNNYSTQGNVNPYTGKAGTVNPCTQNPYAQGCYGK